VLQTGKYKIQFTCIQCKFICHAIKLLQVMTEL